MEGLRVWAVLTLLWQAVLNLLSGTHRRSLRLRGNSESFNGLVGYNAVSFALSDGVKGLCLALYNVGVSDIPITDDSIHIRDVDVNDLVVYLTYGRILSSAGSIYDGLKYGVSLKAIYRDWDEGGAYGIGIDGGLFYTLNAFSIGLFIENLTTTILFWDNGTREYITPLLKSGISYEIPFERLSGVFILAGGLDTNLENKVTRFDAIKSDPHIGLEYVYKDRFAVRTGLDKGELSFGAGVKFGGLRVDYGQSQHADLGTNSRISLNFEF